MYKFLIDRVLIFCPVDGKPEVRGEVTCTHYKPGAALEILHFRGQEHSFLHVKLHGKTVAVLSASHESWPYGQLRLKGLVKREARKYLKERFKNVA